MSDWPEAQIQALQDNRHMTDADLVLVLADHGSYRSIEAIRHRRRLLGMVKSSYSKAPAEYIQPMDEDSRDERDTRHWRRCLEAGGFPRLSEKPGRHGPIVCLPLNYPKGARA